MDFFWELSGEALTAKIYLERLSTSSSNLLVSGSMVGTYEGY